MQTARKTHIRVYYAAKLLNLKQRCSKKACASSTPVRTPYSFRVADNGVGVIDEIARRLMICAYLKRDYVIDKVAPLRLS